MIAKQAELIDLHVQRVNELSSDNERLSKAVVELERASEAGWEGPVMYGSAGFALGILLTVLVYSR